MYSMNWVTYNFMRVRHVSIQGTLWGGGGAIVATAHVMQWCRLPRLVQAPNQIREAIAGDDVVSWGGGGRPGRDNSEKRQKTHIPRRWSQHRHLVQSCIIPSDRGPRKLDDISEV